MRSSYISVLVGFAITVTSSALSTGQLQSINALDQIMGRQVRLCTPVSTPSCSASCGAGFVTCVSWPTCYNPGRGDTCCSSGSYCRAGTYCTDAGCCPNERSLAECRATRTLSVIPPPVAESTTSAAQSTTAASSTTSTASPTTTSSSSTTEAISSSSTTTQSSTTTLSSSSTQSSTTAVITPTTTRSSNGTVTTTTPPVQVTNAASPMHLGVVQGVLGGLALLAAL